MPTPEGRRNDGDIQPIMMAADCLIWYVFRPREAAAVRLTMFGGFTSGRKLAALYEPNHVDVPRPWLLQPCPAGGGDAGRAWSAAGGAVRGSTEDRGGLLGDGQRIVNLMPRYLTVLSTLVSPRRS
jgi:hypothetical protein